MEITVKKQFDKRSPRELMEKGIDFFVAIIGNEISVVKSNNKKTITHIVVKEEEKLALYKKVKAAGRGYYRPTRYRHKRYDFIPIHEYDENKLYTTYSE